MNYEINPSFDSSKLDSFGLEALNLIKAKYPAWLPFICNVNKWEDRFEINIPSPHPDITSLWISTAVGELGTDEIEIGFGFPPINTSLHHKECKTVAQKLAKINEYVKAVETEKLVYAEFVKDRFGLGAGLIERKRVDELLNEGRLRVAYSWKGTYNYNHSKQIEVKPTNWFGYHSFTSIIIPLNIIVLLGLFISGLVTTTPDFYNYELWGNNYITKTLFGFTWYAHTALFIFFFNLFPLFLITSALENIIKPSIISLVYLSCLLIILVFSFLFNPLGLKYLPYEILIINSTIAATLGLYGFSFTFFIFAEEPHGCSIRFIRQLFAVIYIIIVLQTDLSIYWPIGGTIVGLVIGVVVSRMPYIEREMQMISDHVYPEHALIK